MIRDAIMAKQAADKGRIMQNFSNADEVISKGITAEQFEDQYGVGYNVFSKSTLEQFKADCLEKGDDTEVIDAEIAKLKEVEVIKGDATEVFFVQKIEEIIEE